MSWPWRTLLHAGIVYTRTLCTIYVVSKYGVFLSMVTTTRAGQKREFLYSSHIHPPIAGWLPSLHEASMGSKGCRLPGFKSVGSIAQGCLSSSMTIITIPIVSPTLVLAPITGDCYPPSQGPINNSCPPHRFRAHPCTPHSRSRVTLSWSTLCHAGWARLAQVGQVWNGCGMCGPCLPREVKEGSPDRAHDFPSDDFSRCNLSSHPP